MQTTAEDISINAHTSRAVGRLLVERLKTTINLESVHQPGKTDLMSMKV